MNSKNLIFNKLNLNDKNILIFSPSYTINSAFLLGNIFNKLNFKSYTFNNKLFSRELLDLCIPYYNIYFCFFFPQGLVANFPNLQLPKNRYYLYQLEQLNQNTFGYQNLEIIETLVKNSIYTFDYSEINLNYYPSYLKSKIKLMLPSINYLKKFNYEKNIDILFLGTITERRNKILTEIKKKYNIKIVEKTFGEDLDILMKQSKIILNIHSFNNSIFEIFRIHDILSYNCHIISEIPELEENLYYRYKSYINFIDILNDDLSNFSILDNLIDKILSNKIILNNRKNFIQRINCNNINSLNLIINDQVYPYLFNKYHLNLSDPNRELSYKIINNNLNNINKFNTKYAHLHIYDLSEFNNFYGMYIENIQSFFNIIITYSINTNNYKLDNYILLNIANKGMDIGGKILMLQYLLDNNLEYSHVLFLHSKNDNISRKKYFKIIENIPFIKDLLDDEYEAIFPNIKHFEKFDEKFYPNHNYTNEFYKFKNIEISSFNFIEGNVMILGKKIIDYLFINNLKLLYNILNSRDSFDLNWVEWYYKVNSNNKKNIYDLYIKNNWIGNNMKNSSEKTFTHNKLLFQKTIKNSLVGYQFRDGMIEHLFERIYLNTIIKLQVKYKLI